MSKSSFNTRRLLQYQEYKDCFEIKICLKNGKVYHQNFLGGIRVASDVPVRIGVDQSSSQTGLAVKKSTGEFLCLIDFVNSSHINYQLYKSMLGLKIEQLFGDVEVEMCVVEQMWGGNDKSYKMLSNLADYIKGFKYIIPSWSKAEVAEILPNVWRSAYLKSPEYKGMFTKDKVKRAAMKEGIKRYPQLDHYGYYHAEGSHINDSFDALGILEGYEEKTFSSDRTMRKVANTFNTTNCNYSYTLFSCEDKEDLFNAMQRNCPNRQYVEYEYNNDFPFHENVHRVASVTNKVVYMKVDDDVARIQLMWRYGTVITKDELLYLVGWRDRVSDKLDNY